MRRVAALPALWILSLPMLMVACDRAELTGPPEVRVGRDECVECGMLIAEVEFASAFLVDDRGRRRHLIFDDIGCMIDVEGKLDDDTVLLAGFVPDHGDGSWVDARRAHYLVADSDLLRTPMGTGMVAFRDSADADAAAAALGGTVMTHAALTEFRRAWREARRRAYLPDDEVPDPAADP